MPPALASLLTWGFILGLFAWEYRKDGRQSAVLWIPVAWLFITGSRFVSQWMSLGQVGVVNVSDGSTIDAVFFFACIAAGAAVVIRRQVSFGQLIRDNPWMFAFFLFGLISIVWSDFPFIAFKRWIKTLGHPLMALVILTDPNPRKAFITVMKRCAYLSLPLCVLFLKYYPQYGRGFDPWTGEGFNNGIGLNKNYLGYLAMAFGLFFIWYLLVARKIEDKKQRRAELALSAVFIYMACWLLNMSHSATSLTTLLVGTATLLLLGFDFVNKRRIGTYVVLLVGTYVLLDQTLDLYANVLHWLGRKPDLTDRTEVWVDALKLQPNVLVGAGFESFWLGERLDILWSKWWWRPNQAHNGYIETYLNLGAVGIIILAGLLVSTFRKISKQLTVDFDMARVRLAFLFVMIFYNYTEAAFKGVHFMWTLFHIIAINYVSRTATQEQASQKVSKAQPSAPPRPLRTRPIRYR